MINQKYKIKYLLFLIICFSQTACLTLIGKKMGFNNTKAILQPIPFQNKEVYFLGMTHLGKKEYYENVKKVVEDLQAKGFVAYVESVSGTDSTKKYIDSTAIKKIRKITSLDLTVKYSDYHLPLFKELVAKYNLVDQPKYEQLGSTNYKNVDYHYTELIRFYETKYEPVILDSCDLKSQLGIKYNCAKLNNHKRNSFINDIVIKERNKLIAKTIFNAYDKKIVIIYGKKHYNGIIEELDKLK